MNALLATFGGSKIEIIPVIDVIIAIVGIVTLVTANKMKQTNVPPQWLLNPNDLARMKDVKGFCSFLSGRAVVFGIICIVCGVFGEIERTYLHMKTLENVVLIIFLFAVIWFFNTLQKAKRKYS